MKHQPAPAGAPQWAGTLPADATHFVLTRFNVRNFYHKSEPTDAWLRERILLFQKYCLPSMAAQDNRHFTWLVLCDSGSPDWFRREMVAMGEGIYEPVFVEGAFDSSVASEIVGLRCASRFVVTTRLDNDDAAASDFITEIQRAYSGQRREFINLVNGAQFAKGKLYLRPYTQNPFCSLVEEVGADGPETVFAAHHYRIAAHGPVRNVATSHPMWLQVVHDGNVLNEIVGLRTGASSVAPHFGCELETVGGRWNVLAGQFRDGARIMWRLARKPARIGELLRVVAARRGADPESLR